MISNGKLVSEELKVQSIYSIYSRKLSGTVIMPDRMGGLCGNLRKPQQPTFRSKRKFTGNQVRKPI